MTSRMNEREVTARAEAVWRALSLAFPSFTTVYGTEPQTLWVEKIATLSNEQCRAGVTSLGRWSDKSFPPNLTQFEVASLAAEVRTERPRPSFERPAGQPAVRERYMAKIRATLGMPPK